MSLICHHVLFFSCSEIGAEDPWLSTVENLGFFVGRHKSGPGFPATCGALRTAGAADLV